MDSFEKMYSVKEAAAVLGCSPDTVRRRIGDGSIRAWKLFGGTSQRKRKYESWRIPESSLKRFMSDGSNAA
jgi:excisionase family DNA binding protein